MYNENKFTVFFGGLKQDVTIDNLQQWTEMFGEVSNIRIIPNKKNPNGLNVAFVDMDSPEARQACLDYYHDYPLVIDNITVTICVARDKNEQKVVSHRPNRNNGYRPEYRTQYAGCRRSARNYNSYEDDQNSEFRGSSRHYNSYDYNQDENAYDSRRRNSYETRRGERSFNRYDR